MRWIVTVMRWIVTIMRWFRYDHEVGLELQTCLILHGVNAMRCTFRLNYLQGHEVLRKRRCACWILKTFNVHQDIQGGSIDKLNDSAAALVDDRQGLITACKGLTVVG